VFSLPGCQYCLTKASPEKLALTSTCFTRPVRELGGGTGLSALGPAVVPAAERSPRERRGSAGPYLGAFPAGRVRSGGCQVAGGGPSGLLRAWDGAGGGWREDRAQRAGRSRLVAAAALRGLVEACWLSVKLD